MASLTTKDEQKRKNKKNVTELDSAEKKNRTKIIEH